MTPFLNALATVALIAGGSCAIIYALRFFPIHKATSDQLELELDDYLKRSRTVTQATNREANAIREEVARYKAKPRPKR